MPPCAVTTADIRDAEQIAAMFDAAESAFHLPDVLINNAAANFPVPSEDMSPNAWRSVIDITLNGTFLVTREFGRRHLAAQHTGIDRERGRVRTRGPVARDGCTAPRRRRA